ncbi:MAG: alpha/beta hydrolase [Pseudomonadales bacterium]
MAYNFDPELIEMIAMVPDSNFGNPVAARCGIEEMMSALNADIDESGIETEDRAIPGPEGAPDVPVRLYTPDNLAGVTAGLIYIHGGGFAVGSLDTEHAGAVNFCRDLGIVIVSVDYRLAPENPYPAGLEDCYAALCWTRGNAAKLNIDVDRIGVMGGSAGGGLSAALALLSRDRNGPKLCFQMLGIPELDDRLQTRSMLAFTDTPMWHRPNAILSWQYYLGANYTPGGDDVPYHAAPARATVEDLVGLPPAYVSTMEYDPLRDEGIEYALRMLQAGVNVELHSFPGTYHGSSMVTHAAVSIRGLEESKTALRRGLGL